MVFDRVIRDLIELKEKSMTMDGFMISGIWGSLSAEQLNLIDQASTKAVGSIQIGVYNLLNTYCTRKDLGEISRNPHDTSYPSITFKILLNPRYPSIALTL